MREGAGTGLRGVAPVAIGDWDLRVREEVRFSGGRSGAMTQLQPSPLWAALPPLRPRRGPHRHAALPRTTLPAVAALLLFALALLAGSGDVSWNAADAAAIPGASTAASPSSSSAAASSVLELDAHTLFTALGNASAVVLFSVAWCGLCQVSGTVGGGGLPWKWTERVLSGFWRRVCLQLRYGATLLSCCSSKKAGKMNV